MSASLGGSLGSLGVERGGFAADESDGEDALRGLLIGARSAWRSFEDMARVRRHVACGAVIAVVALVALAAFVVADVAPSVRGAVRAQLAVADHADGAGPELREYGLPGRGMMTPSSAIHFHCASGDVDGGWSQIKKNYCCKTAGVGCAPGAATAHAPPARPAAAATAKATIEAPPKAALPVAVAPPKAALPVAVSPNLLPPQKCSWANEDCQHTKLCCNVECDYTFKNCQKFSCFKKDNFAGGFAGCKAGKPGGWTGPQIGGPIEPRVVPQAPGNSAIQGTSLFCFSVVMWDAGPAAGWMNSEAELANNWKRKGQHILECDDHMILDGMNAPRSGWGSTSNIDVFIKYWAQVKADGRYASHDWIVKVDTDAVFFPQRLKLHLESLRTPRGAPVFLLNNAYRFNFLGALEVMTRQAADLYFQNADRCSVGEGGHSGGEDYYMKVCLIGSGVDVQKDFTLLHDKYASQNGCSDGWAAAFHFFKKTSEWNWCHSEAVAAQKAHDEQWNAKHPAVV